MKNENIKRDWKNYNIINEALTLQGLSYKVFLQPCNSVVRLNYCNALFSAVHHIERAPDMTLPGGAGLYLYDWTCEYRHSLNYAADSFRKVRHKLDFA